MKQYFYSAVKTFSPIFLTLFIVYQLLLLTFVIHIYTKDCTR